MAAVGVAGFDIVPGRDVGRGNRGRDARGSCTFERSDERGGRAEDGVEMMIDVRFDIDGI